VALWLGSESEGLSEEAENLCDHFVTIPMVGGVQSLNIASGAAILVAELRRLRDTAPAGPPPCVVPTAAEQLTKALLAQRESFLRAARQERESLKAQWLPREYYDKIGDQLVKAGVVREASGEFVAKAKDLLPSRIMHISQAGPTVKEWLGYPLNETLACKLRKKSVDDESIAETAKLLLDVSKHYDFDDLLKDPKALKLIAKSIGVKRGVTDEKLLYRPIRLCLTGRLLGPPMFLLFEFMNLIDDNVICDVIPLRQRVESLTFLIS